MIVADDDDIDDASVVAGNDVTVPSVADSDVVAWDDAGNCWGVIQPQRQ